MVKSRHDEKFTYMRQVLAGLLKNCMFGFCDLGSDKKVTRRKDELVSEAKLIVKSIRAMVSTARIDGAVYAVEPGSGRILKESDRLVALPARAEN